MLSLIVNGDDFGLSEKVNEGILKSYQYGILRSASLMANGESFEHAIKIIKSNPQLDIGVHLTLVEEEPILDGNRISSLVNEDGRFHKHAIDFSKKYFSKKIVLEEVRIELNAQIKKILDNGIKISHLDSHQHLHILPEILTIAIELADRYKINYIRIPSERLKGYMFHNIKSLDRIIQRMVLNHYCEKAKSKISNKTDYFTGFYFGGKLTKKNLLTIIKNLPAEGVCELMCHPGFEDNSNKYSHWKYQQVDEMLALIDEETASYLKSQNVRVTSFQNLPI